MIRERGSRDRDIQVLYAELLYQAGEIIQAAHLASQILADTPGLSALLRARLAMIRSSCQYDHGDYKSAIDYAFEALDA